MAQMLGPSFLQSLTASAVPLSGGKLHVYLSGTTTPAALYTDEGLTTPASNPLEADTAGVFPPAYTSEIKVKVIQKTAAGVTVRTADPIYTIGRADDLPASGISYSGATSGLASEDVQAALDEIVSLQATSQRWSSASDGAIATGISTNTGAAAGPLFEAYRDSASPAASDVIGGRRDAGRNAAGSKVTYAQDHTVILDTTNGSEDAKRVVQTVVAGSLADRTHTGAGMWMDGATGGDPGIGKMNASEIQQDGNAIRPLLSATAQATTSGTAKDFTSIPTWAKRITIPVSGVSTNGGSALMIQLGDSGGIENTGYAGSVSNTYSDDENETSSFSAGFLISQGLSSGNTLNGIVTLTLTDAATNTWACFSVCGESGGRTHYGGGSKALSATLDRVRFTTANGTDVFDLGSINVLYE